MAEQSSHATHSAQDATEVKLTSLVFLLSNKQMLRASMIFWITLFHWMLGEINLVGTASHYGPVISTKFRQRLWKSSSSQCLNHEYRLFKRCFFP